MKVVIAGSRRLPAGEAPRLLISFLAEVPGDSLVLLRRGLRTSPGRFESDVAALCGMLGIDVEWCQPYPTDRFPGRESVYVRDIDMVERADLVILFFADDEDQHGYSGTFHLFEKAMDVGRAVYAYAVDDHGVVRRVGEHDPHHLYHEIVPAS